MARDKHTLPENMPPRAVPWSITVCETCGYYFADCDACVNGAALREYRAAKRARTAAQYAAAVDALGGYQPNPLTMPIVTHNE